jgi:hypothetical protein
MWESLISLESAVVEAGHGDIEGALGVFDDAVRPTGDDGNEVNIKDPEPSATAGPVSDQRHPRLGGWVFRRWTDSTWALIPDDVRSSGGWLNDLLGR